MYNNFANRRREQLYTANEWKELQNALKLVFSYM